MTLLTRPIEFFFDVGSPTTYLAWTQLPRLAEEVGAELVWRPMLLGGVFKATGNASPVTVPAKGRWMLGDLQRWADRHRRRGSHVCRGIQRRAGHSVKEGGDAVKFFNFSCK